MRPIIWLAMTSSVVLGLLMACAPAAPTSPTRPAAALGTPTAAMSPVTGAPATATKPPATSPTAAPAAKIKRGGNLRAAHSWTIPTFDPHLATWFSAVGYEMYDSFLRYDMVEASPVKFDVRPELAESWEMADPKTLVFKIRSGVKFHDGTDFDVKAAKFNLERMVTHQKSVLKAPLNAIDKVEEMDASRIRVTLKAPSAGILVQIAQPTSFRTGIVSPSAVQKLGDDEFGRKPVGSGPFQFVNWVADDHATLKKFDGYWRKGVDGQPLPYLDGYVYRYITDPSVSLLELRAGNLDLLEGVEAKDVASIKSNPELTFLEIPWAGGGYPALGLYIQGQVMGKDKRLRQAAFYSLDRESMAKALGFGLAKPWYYPYWGEGTLGYDPSLPKYDYQQQKAKDLLKEAGYPNGVELTLDTIARQPEQRIAEMMKSMWDSVGLKTTINALERLAWIDKVYTAKKFDASIWRGPLMFDPGIVGLYLKTGAAQNWGSYSNPEVDKMIDQADTMYDPKDRAEIYKKIQRQVYEDAYISYGYNLPDGKAMTSKLKGLKVQWSISDPSEAWFDR